MKLKLFILATLLFGSFQLLAQDFSIVNNEGDKIYYNIVPDSTLAVEVTNLAGGLQDSGAGSYKGIINITNTITYEGETYNVIGIGDYAFFDCGRLTAIDLPTTLKYIGDGAFLGCWSLNSVTIHDGVTSIGDNAFGYCNQLQNIQLPQSDLTHIGAKAFYNCNTLTNITLPNTLTAISDGLFQYCTMLNSIIIPNSAISIGANAFNNCSSMSLITIGNKVQRINNSAFYDCTNLEMIVLPNSVKKIGEKAFMNCINLRSISLSTTLDTIDNSAFYNCSQLFNISIPNSVTTISDKAFSNCYAIKKVTIGKNVKHIGYNAFSGNQNLKIVQWNARAVSDYYNYSFYPEIEEHPFYNTNLNDVNFGNNVKIIPPYAFFHCNIKNIHIGDSVTTVGDYAFANCHQVELIEVSAKKPPVINNRAFQNIDTTTIVEIPCSNIAEYMANPFWNRFVNIYCNHNLFVVSNHPAFGSVIGGGKYRDNTIAIIQAIPHDGNIFEKWDDGNIENPRRIRMIQDTSFIAIFKNEFDGIDDNKVPNTIAIYPNPTTGLIHIDAEKIELVEVYNIIGKRIATFQNSNTIDLSNLIAGQYILRIQTDSNIATKQLILQ